MKFFKFDWFKSEERNQLKKALQEKEEKIRQLELENARLAGYREGIEEGTIAEAQREEILSHMPESAVKAEEEAMKSLATQKPYRVRRLIGEVLTVILWDGTPLTGGKDLYDAVGNAKTEDEVIDIFTIKPESKEVVNTTPIPETEEEKQTIRDNWAVLRDHEDFEIRDNEAYLKVVKLPLPAVVAASFIEILEKVYANIWDTSEDIEAVYTEQALLLEQYQALKMFWLKLSVNPIEQSRNQLLTFCKKNDVRITKTGNLVLYRRLVSYENKTNKELVAFISTQYTKIKGWKKAPKNFLVVEDTVTGKIVYSLEKGDFSVAEDSTAKITGNLQKLYEGLSGMTENIYTSYHNQGRYKIKIGSIYKEDEEMLNTDAGLCSAGGLHAAAVTWDYSSFGDTPVVVLVNPSKALTVPTSDTGKLRTTEMFIVCVNDKPQGEHFDDVMLSDEEYNKITIEELENAVATKDFSALAIKEHVTKISAEDIKAITASLKNRVVEVV